MVVVVVLLLLLLLPAKQHDFSATASPMSTPSATSPVTLPWGSGSDRAVSDRSGSERSASERSIRSALTTPGSACVPAGTPGSWPPAWMRTPGSWPGSTCQPAFTADRARLASCTEALRPTLCFASGAGTPGSWPGSGPDTSTSASSPGEGSLPEDSTPRRQPGMLSPEERAAAASERRGREVSARRTEGGGRSEGGGRRRGGSGREEVGRSASPLQSCRPGSPLQRFPRSSPSSCGEARAARSEAQAEAQAEVEVARALVAMAVAPWPTAEAAEARAPPSWHAMLCCIAA